MTSVYTVVCTELLTNTALFSYHVDVGVKLDYPCVCCSPLV